VETTFLVTASRRIAGITASSGRPMHAGEHENARDGSLTLSDVRVPGGVVYILAIRSVRA
jgi:hypothetical protein